MDKLRSAILEAIKDGNSGDPEFRRSVYDHALNSLKDAAAVQPNPDTFLSQYEPSIVKLIETIEASYAKKPESEATSLSPIPEHISMPQVAAHDVPIYSQMESKKMSTSSKTLLSVVALALIGGGAYYALNTANQTGIDSVIAETAQTKVSEPETMVSKQEPVEEKSETTPIVKSEERVETTTPSTQSTQETMSASSQTVSDAPKIDIAVGSNLVERGDATKNEESGFMALSDESSEKTQGYRWIVKDVPANQSHEIKTIFGKDTIEGAKTQLQIVYAGDGFETRVYSYIVDTVSGVVIPRGLAKGPRFDMKRDGDNWSLTTTMQTPDGSSTMQVLLRPAIGKGAVGTVRVQLLEVQALS